MGRRDLRDAGAARDRWRGSLRSEVHPKRGETAVDYRGRISQRSRRVRLNLSARDGLTIVIPMGFDARRIPAIVEARKGWIEKHLRRVSEGARVLARDPP